ncbi:MAG: nucleoside 2-deoxyribosyltransferase [Clostridia bacterium]|jgi:nucleoside 2-deoxyribosyltransferase|nr:nucleoside 2-deoxyribosyltransferase [Clostridia bacterium]MCX4367151.1 nucleoside 2-deoxyribosyltransferase [Clostridia bacterium]
MITSSKIQEKILQYLSDEKEHTVQDIKNYLAENSFDNYTEGQFAGSITTLLRNGSIKKIDRGIYSIRARSESMKKCFVVSPIGEEGSVTRINADKLFKYIIKPVCADCDFEAIRVDKLNDANSITQTIIDYLDKSELVIADITEHNPNVFYEMGYRARTKKPIIHLKSKGENLPFDINTIRALEYDLTDLDSVEEIKKRLTKTIESFNYSEFTDVSEKEESNDSVSSAVMPTLYQIIDSLDDVKKEIKNINNETISTVIKSMQNVQPQIQADTALKMQMLNSFMQNPDKIIQMYELSERLKKKDM